MLWVRCPPFFRGRAVVSHVIFSPISQARLATLKSIPLTCITLTAAGCYLRRYVFSFPRLPPLVRAGFLVVGDVHTYIYIYIPPPPYRASTPALQQPGFNFYSAFDVLLLGASLAS